VLVEKSPKTITPDSIPEQLRSRFVAYLLKSEVLLQSMIAHSDSKETASTAHKLIISNEDLRKKLFTLEKRKKLAISRDLQEHFYGFVNKVPPTNCSKVVFVHLRDIEAVKTVLREQLTRSDAKLVLHIDSYGKMMVNGGAVAQTELGERARQNQDNILQFVLAEIDLLSLCGPCTTTVAVLTEPPASLQDPTSSSTSKVRRFNVITKNKLLTKSSTLCKPLLSSDENLNYYGLQLDPTASRSRQIAQHLFKNLPTSSERSSESQQLSRGRPQAELILKLQYRDVPELLRPQRKSDDFFDRFPRFGNFRELLRSVNDSEATLTLMHGRTLKSNPLEWFYDLNLAPTNPTVRATRDEPSAVTPTVVVGTDFNLKELIVQTFVEVIVRADRWLAKKTG